MLSFADDNVFILCGVHHRAFDGFRLKTLEIERIRDYIEPKLHQFTVMADGYIGERGKKRLEVWSERINKLLFGGGEVVSFAFIKQ